MSFWTGIKHALNSTLGKSDFQPLDKIIKNNAMFVKGDTVLYSEDLTIDDEDRALYIFTPELSGDLTLKLTGIDPDVQYDVKFNIIVTDEKNGFIYGKSAQIGETAEFTFFVHPENVGNVLTIAIENVVLRFPNVDLVYRADLCATVIPYLNPLQVDYP